MPPRKYSRYTYTTAVTDENGKLFLTERVPFRFRVYSDTVQHIASEGDSLSSLANRHYAGIPRASGLWWVIADFQPEPIVDPTLLLTPGTVLFIPSLRVLQEEIFSETRRGEDASG